MLGALGVARWASGMGRASLAWGGLALGAGLTIKPHAVLFAGALAAVVLVVGVRRGSAVTAPLAIFLGAMAVMPAAVTTWIAAAGGLAAWRDIVLHYLVPYYVRLGRPTSWAFYRWHVWMPLAAAVGLALVHAVLARRFTVRHAIAALGAAYGLAHYVGQGKGWEYHLYPLAAFAGLLAFAELGSALAHGRVLGVPLAASLALTLVLLAQRGVEAANAGWIRDKADSVREVTRDLGAFAPGEAVQVLDTTDGGLHALLRLGARPADALPVRLPLLPRRGDRRDPGAPRGADARPRRASAALRRPVRPRVAGRGARAHRALSRARALADRALPRPPLPRGLHGV